MSVVNAVVSTMPNNGSELLVGCSGGVDSVVLVYSLVKLGYRPHLLHINYQLRGEASEQDAVFVDEFAKQMNLECTVILCPQALTKGPGINLQEAARTFRRQHFLKWIEKGPTHFVVLGHHQDDQIETFFLQLARGAGTLGLGGMHENRHQIIRPFLTLPKSALITYAKENKLSWREDQSNQTVDYARNKLRLAILPELMNQFPKLRPAILDFQAACRNFATDLTNQLRESCQNFTQEKEIPLANWNQFSQEEKRVCIQLINWPNWTFERMEQLAKGRKSNFFYVKDLLVYRTKTSICWKDSMPTNLTWDFKIENVEFLPEQFSKYELFLDRTKIKGALRMRPWHPSDAISIIGINGKQLVSSALKNAGIPLQERANYWVLTDDQHVLWIPEIKVSKIALAQAESTSIIKIVLKKNK